MKITLSQSRVEQAHYCFAGDNMVQSLKIVPRLLSEVRTGIKTHTIRWREQEIVSGAMIYVNASDTSDTARVMVTKVKKMPLSAVAGYLDKRDAWPDKVLLAGMREHYPDIELDSEVDVIHHLASAND